MTVSNSGINFINIDIHDSEQFILEGSKETLNDVFSLEIEVKFVQACQDVPLIADVDNFIRHFACQLSDLEQLFYKIMSGKFILETRSILGKKC